MKHAVESGESLRLGTFLDMDTGTGISDTHTSYMLAKLRIMGLDTTVNLSGRLVKETTTNGSVSDPHRPFFSSLVNTQTSLCSSLVYGLANGLTVGIAVNLTGS